MGGGEARPLGWTKRAPPDGERTGPGEGAAGAGRGRAAARDSRAACGRRKALPLAPARPRLAVGHRHRGVVAAHVGEPRQPQPQRPAAAAAAAAAARERRARARRGLAQRGRGGGAARIGIQLEHHQSQVQQRRRHKRGLQAGQPPARGARVGADAGAPFRQRGGRGRRQAERHAGEGVVVQQARVDRVLEHALDAPRRRLGRLRRRRADDDGVARGRAAGRRRRRRRRVAAAVARDLDGRAGLALDLAKLLPLAPDDERQDRAVEQHALDESAAALGGAQVGARRLLLWLLLRVLLLWLLRMVLLLLLWVLRMVLLLLLLLRLLRMVLLLRLLLLSRRRRSRRRLFGRRP
jgi:hypothetical protein